MGGGEAALERALGVAYAFVNQRERTVAEVRGQLERKGFAPPVVDDCLRTLVDQRLVDDDRFARLYVSDKRELEQWGSERIRRGLIARGIEREVAAAAINAASQPRAGAPAGDGWGEPAGVEPGHEDPITELDRALALLRSRFPEPPRERRERDRALGVLLRKGYESELALDALSVYARSD